MCITDLSIKQVDDEITYLPVDHDYEAYFKQFNKSFRSEYQKRGYYKYNQLVMFNNKKVNTK